MGSLSYSYPRIIHKHIHQSLPSSIFKTTKDALKQSPSTHNNSSKLITVMHSPSPLTFFLLFISLSSSFHLTTTKTTIAFRSLGRSRYNFDIFAIPISSPSLTPQNELQLTDGISVNFNGFFTSNSSSLIFVTERNGLSNIYTTSSSSSRSPTPFTFPLLPPSLSMKDRPSLHGDHLLYVSTHEASPTPRRSWAAVYSTHLVTGETRRLTPYNVADFSPSVSPSGQWTAVASSGAVGWSGESEELSTSIYVFRTVDGLMRKKVIEHGGWPCWGNEDTLYFHRRSEDGWWSAYRARIRTSLMVVLGVERVTPPGFHAFTPAASVGLPGVIAVATRRAGSEYRHIELVDVQSSSNSYVEVTRLVSPYTQHYNPFISPDGTRVGYHRCRGGGNGSPPLFLESIQSSLSEEFSLFRIDGSFPSFSPEGDRVAFVELPGLFVANSDGSGKPRKVFDGNSFPTVWDWKKKGKIYTSYGPDFASDTTTVDIISITLTSDDENSKPLIETLTLGGENNAFPSPSPDGKWIVFRSGRSGHRNLYVMDANEGERGGIYRLTEGEWTDTMCVWSPNGEWIAFASDRDSPGNGGFAIYMVHPNGTGLRKVVHSGDGGRTNHPWFSPDSKRIVFTSDYSAVSGEPISNPHSYQPYGEIYIANIDGSGIQRLTHNSFEDGTPTWTQAFKEPVDVAEFLKGSEHCSFDDCAWLNISSSCL